MAKYIFVAGGVMSGIGKGITNASLSMLLKSKGFKVTAMKMDPYVNVDAGTMDLEIHGEAFVTEDGDQCDQDMGNYERFLDETLSKDNYMTTGRVYQTVINRERNLGYNGKCVEVVPHIPEEVIRRINNAQKKTKSDFVLIEIGGTVGEYQNLLFLEAARMLKLKRPKDVVFILVSYLPNPKIIGEMKTKPTQYAVRTLNSAGIQPDIIIARSEVVLDELRKEKISVFCNVNKKDIISAPDIKSIYEIPLNFEKDDLGNRILKKFNIKSRKNNLKKWKKLVGVINKNKKPVKIGIIEKDIKPEATALTDCHLSMVEAIKHAAWSLDRHPEIYWLDSEKYKNNKKLLKELKAFDGIIVPGGFKDRGVEGKIKVIEYCRKNKIPFFGICLGMQLAAIEFARNVCGLKKANSTEFSKNCQVPIIDLTQKQKKNLEKGENAKTIRLGAYPCKLDPKSLSYKAYKSSIILERHRNVYELNNEFKELLEKKGMLMAGINPKQNLVEIIEIPSHPFFIGVQFHPEFKSRPLRPHPLFRGFIKECIKKVPR